MLTPPIIDEATLQEFLEFLDSSFPEVPQMQHPKLLLNLFDTALQQWNNNELWFLRSYCKVSDMTTANQGAFTNSLDPVPVATECFSKCLTRWHANKDFWFRTRGWCPSCLLNGVWHDMPTKVSCYARGCCPSCHRAVSKATSNQQPT